MTDVAHECLARQELSYEERNLEAVEVAQILEFWEEYRSKIQGIVENRRSADTLNHPIV